MPTSSAQIGVDFETPGLAAWWLGRVEYGAAWGLQRELVDLRRAGRIPDTLLLLEHPRTITLGRRSKETDLLEPRESLVARGFSIYDVDRGGEVTYHGPGQLVGYPILDLSDLGRDLHAHIRKIEQALIRALEPFGIRGIRNPPHTGVWVSERKIAAIGIKVSRWVTSHGFALNVSTDMSDFDVIVPCGIRDFGVTSMEVDSRAQCDVFRVIPHVVRSFAEVFGSAAGQRDSADSGLTEMRELVHGKDSAKILGQAIDARKIGVIDYAPLSGGSDFSGIRGEEI